MLATMQSKNNNLLNPGRSLHSAATQLPHEYIPPPKTLRFQETNCEGVILSIVMSICYACG